MKFSRKIIFLFSALCILGSTVESHAGMTTSSFQIPASVISGGGMPMASASYKTNATLGQASPVGMTLSSANFLVDSGFWPAIYYVSILAGDINNDGVVNLADAVLAIKLMSNMAAPLPIFKEADVNKDGLIGLEEALQALQVTSGLKSQP